MARFKEFDQEKVLDRAVDMFWTNGYERTSVQDLCEHLGIHRGSLYNTFGDKHQLFLTCLDQYRVQAENNLFSILNEAGSAKDLLERFFTKVIESSMINRRGCFIGNSAVVVAPFDSKVASRVEANVLDLETIFYRLLIRAQKTGELKGNQNLHTLARFLVTTMRGIEVMAKTAPESSGLLGVAKTALSFLFKS